MLDKLTKLRTQRAQLVIQLYNIDNEIAPLEASLNQFINPAAHTQPVATPIQVTTQVNQCTQQQHKPITQPVTQPVTQAITKPLPLSTIKTVVPAKPMPPTQLATNAAPKQIATTAASTTVQGMEAMVLKSPLPHRTITNYVCNR